MGAFHDLGLQSTGLTGRTQYGLEELRTLAGPLYKTRTGQGEIYGLPLPLFYFGNIPQCAGEGGDLVL